MFADLSGIKSDPFLSLFKKNLRDNFRIKKKHKILLCVSGGLDSMVLFFLFLAIKYYRIQVAHVNYNLRKEADDEMNFVKQISEKFNIPFFSSTFNAGSMDKGQNFEAWAREKRYKYFEEVSSEEGIDWIATAHQRNDNVQTLFLNLSRKTGLSGLKGITEKRGKVLRPLLRFSKSELKDFSTRNKIPYFDDKSNNNQKYYRNFIRHSILKTWQDYDYRIIKSLDSSIKFFVEWNNAIDSLIKSVFIDTIQISDNRIEIPYKLINELHINVIIRTFQIITIGKNALWKKHEICEIKDFISSKKIGKKIKIKDKWVFVHDRYFILGEKLSLLNDKKSEKIKLEKEIIFNDNIYKISLKNKEDLLIKNNGNYEYINWDLIKNKKLILRYWKEGDYFYPLGMNSKQKLSDFLTNNKLDYFSKLKQTVMSADGEIFWVCGKRIANWVKINKNTKEVVSLERIKNQS